MPAGFSFPAEDYLEIPLDFSGFLIKNKAATFMMRVDGGSMCDAGVLNGDLLVVDRAAKPVNGSVVVVAVNGEYNVKRWRAAPTACGSNPRTRVINHPRRYRRRAACLRCCETAIHTLR